MVPQRGPGRRSFVPLERFSSADRHLTQRNAELGGAARLSHKERFQNTCTAAVLSTSGVRMPRWCATRCNLQNGHRRTTTICGNKQGIPFQLR